jgi:hypothetical protein
MALLLTSVFGVTGCGSDDDVQAESRVKNAAPQADSGEDRPYLGYCLDLSDLSDLSKPDPDFLLEVLERLYSHDSLGRNGLDYSEVDDLMSAISDNSAFRDFRYLLNLLSTPSGFEGLDRIMSISLDRLSGLLDLDDLSDSKSLIKTIAKFDFLDSSDNRNIRDLQKFYDDINLKDLSVLQYLIDEGLLDNENNTVFDLMTLINNDDKGFEMVMTNISLIAHSDLFNIRDRLKVCDDASESGTGADDDMSSAPTTVPAVDDAVSDDSTESASVCFEPLVEQFREDLALFRAAQNGRNDQSLTEEQRQGHRDNYNSAYDVKTKSAAAAIEVANERGFNLDSPDNLDESFLRKWDSTICE